MNIGSEDLENELFGFFVVLNEHKIISVLPGTWEKIHEEICKFVQEMKDY